MKFLRKNKYTILAIIILIIVVVIGVQVKNIFVPDTQKASYGSRLDGINNHKLSDELFKDIESKLKEDEKILSVEHKVHGKIINLIITVSDDYSVESAKNLANGTISLFEKDELSYYSLQVYIKKNDTKQNNFPIIGYKGTQSTSLSFTKDRQITEGE